MRAKVSPAVVTGALTRPSADARSRGVWEATAAPRGTCQIPAALVVHTPVSQPGRWGRRPGPHQVWLDPGGPGRRGSSRLLLPPPRQLSVHKGFRSPPAARPGRGRGRGAHGTGNLPLSPRTLLGGTAAIVSGGTFGRQQGSRSPGCPWVGSCRAGAPESLQEAGKGLHPPRRSPPGWLRRRGSAPRAEALRRVQGSGRAGVAVCVPLTGPSPVRDSPGYRTERGGGARGVVGGGAKH